MFVGSVSAAVWLHAFSLRKLLLSYPEQTSALCPILHSLGQASQKGRTRLHLDPTAMGNVPREVLEMLRILLALLKPPHSCLQLC